MASWRSMLAGLFVWAAHFFTLYVLASVFGTSVEARIGTLIATGVALALLAAILLSARRRPAADPLTRWMASLRLLAAALTILAVIWQAMPALVG